MITVKNGDATTSRVCFNDSLLISETGTIIGGVQKYHEQRAPQKLFRNCFICAGEGIVLAGIDEVLLRTQSHEWSKAQGA